MWPLATVQTCIIHLIRNTFKLRLGERLGRAETIGEADLHRPDRGGGTSSARRGDRRWGTQYGAIVRLWESTWEEFIPFLAYDHEIREVICSTNAIKSLNARYWRAVRAGGHFPTDQAALKCRYLAIGALDPT